MKQLPHLVAVLLVMATVVLLSFGALVTTYEAAMAVPDWPATYGRNMFLFPLAEWLGGPWDLFLEHGHRLLGAAVGLITLALAAVVWRWSPSAAVRCLAVAAVVLVLIQGGLGGARVLLDDTTVAKVHACTGPLFFAVAVALAALTRQTGAVMMPRVAAGIAAAVPIAAYAQLVAGAQLRHLDPATPPRIFHLLVGTHVLGAIVVALIVAALAVMTRGTTNLRARRWALVLTAAVVGQLLLGGGTWVAKYGMPSAMLPDGWRLSAPIVARSGWGAATVTTHAVLGMLILGGGVALAIAAAGPAGSAREPNVPLFARGSFRRHTGVPA